MLEKVNGNSSPAADHAGAKRKSRSPSPQPSFGPTEMLQRERLKRLRKEKVENGCVQVRLNGSKSSARKTINPGRLSVNKVELLSAVVKRPGQVEDGGGVKTATEDGRDATTCDKQTNVSADSAKRPKIDFVMEESDEENEEENEGLKKLVEDIDNDLGIPEEKRKTRKEDEDQRRTVNKNSVETERRRKRPSVQRKKEEEVTAEESEHSLVNQTITLESSAEADEEIPVQMEKKKNDGEASKEEEKEEEDGEKRRLNVDEKGKEEEVALVLGDSPVDEKESEKERKEEDEKESVLEVILEEDSVPTAEDSGEATPDASGTAILEEKKKEDSGAKTFTGTTVKKEVEPDVKDASAAAMKVDSVAEHTVTPAEHTTKVKVKKEETKKMETDQSGDVEVVDSELKADALSEPQKLEDLGGGGGGVGKDKIYRLTKSELEMLVINKVTEFFSDSNKSELGALRHRCEQLEKYLEQWRRKAQFYQKQMTDMQSLIQRARKFALPQRPSMRSVGLQVQLTRYIPADPSKLVSRVAQMAVPVSKPQQQQQPLTGQPQVIVPKQVSANQLAFVTNLGPQGSLTGATFINKNGMPQMSNVGLTATVNTILASRPMTSTFSMPTRPNATIGQFHGGQMGVSLLHPRISSAPGTYIIGSTQNVTGTTGTVVKAPGSGPLLRATLDSAKAASNAAAGAPVPTCLVQNQALISGTTTTSSATARPPALPLIGQPTVLAPGVKLIDLTADEEDAKAQQAAAAAAAAFALAAASSTAATPLAPGTMTMMPATLCTGNNTMTVLTPSTVSGVSTGQLLALSSAIVSNTGTLASATPLRVTAPIRGATANAIVNNSGPVRLTYLMPTSSMMTMVRPNQPMFVTPSTGIRPGPAGVPRQGLPTIVLQRGTTLVPLQQGSMTTMPTARPGAIISSPTRTISTPGGPVTFVGAPTASRTGTTPATTTSAATAVTSFNLTSGAANAMLNVPVAKMVTPPSHVPRHPAPLPIQPKYPDLPPSSGKKAVPPRPTLKISKVSNGIVLSWNMCLTSSHSDIASYQLYAYQEGASAPSTALWKKVGDVKALPLPMACTLTQFMEGHKYYFAVRAVDTFNRLGPFSDPGSIALMTAGATPAVVAAAPVGKPTPVALKS